jgi:prevent-host-death family protein
MSVSTITITELRNHFDEYLQRVKAGEVFIITKYGKPFAQFAPAQEVLKQEKTALFQSKEDVA